MMHRNRFLGFPTFALIIALCLTFVNHAVADNKAQRFARFRVGNKVAYGIVEGKTVREISGNLFGKWQKTDRTHALSEIKLLAPTKPTQVIAMAGNYKSHLKDAKIPPKFRIPQPFFKSPSCLLRHGGAILLPKGDDHIHYEAEMVIVIGKKAKKVSKERALEYVFGVTCGNDVSARTWQNNKETKDVQWWRAKGSDTFGPCGPFITSGLNYDDLAISLRLNGETRQEARTSQFIHDVPTMVSFVSQHVTLHPGDLIFTGTPGKTAGMKPGDVVEVEIEGVGILRNSVKADKQAAAREGSGLRTGANRRSV